MKLISILTTVSQAVPTAFSEDCNLVNFSPKTYPRTAVTSFPGSGNTWFRNLMHMATGYHTGSVYDDNKLIDEGFLGEALPWNSDEVLGIKVHTMVKAETVAKESSIRLENAFPKAILVIRSPYGAILSEFNRRNNPTKDHTGSAPYSLFRSSVWKKFVETQSMRWEKQILNWLEDYDGDIHVVCYEELKYGDTATAVKGAMQFISEEITLRSECLTHENADGRFKRETDDTKKPTFHYSDEMISSLDKRIQKVKKSLDTKGYEDCTRLF